MKRRDMSTGMGVVLCLLLLAIPLAVRAEPETGDVQPPPISQHLVREGAFAVTLAEELEIASTNDEAEAESRLADAGIAPRNGWIADYPMTPDIIAELRRAVRSAAEADKLHFEPDEALRRFDRANQRLNLTVTPTPVTITGPGPNGTTTTQQRQMIGLKYPGPPMPVKYNVLSAIPASVAFTGDMISATWDALVSLPTKTARSRLVTSESGTAMLSIRFPGVKAASTWAKFQLLSTVTGRRYRNTLSPCTVVSR